MTGASVVCYEWKRVFRRLWRVRETVNREDEMFSGTFLSHWKHVLGYGAKTKERKKKITQRNVGPNIWMRSCISHLLVKSNLRHTHIHARIELSP